MKIVSLDKNGYIREELPGIFSSIDELHGACSESFIDSCVLVDDSVPLNVIYNKETGEYREPKASDFYSEQLLKMHSIIDEI